MGKDIDEQNGDPEVGDGDPEGGQAVDAPLHPGVPFQYAEHSQCDAQDGTDNQGNSPQKERDRGPAQQNVQHACVVVG